MHTAEVVAPITTLKKPAAHAVQPVVAVERELYEPEEHGKHTELVTYAPLLHVVHTAEEVAPTVPTAENVPALQAVQPTVAVESVL